MTNIDYVFVQLTQTIFFRTQILLIVYFKVKINKLCNSILHNFLHLKEFMYYLV